MEPYFEIPLAGRIDPGPKPAATDEITIAVIEERPILNAARAFPLDLVAQPLFDLLRCQLAAGVDQCRDRGIAP